MPETAKPWELHHFEFECGLDPNNESKDQGRPLDSKHCKRAQNLKVCHLMKRNKRISALIVFLALQEAGKHHLHRF